VSDTSPPPVRLTWVGHATVLIEVGETRIITDPALTHRLAHLRRRHPEPDVASVDSVLLSHLHMDHLHAPSLRRVAGGAHVVAPAGGERFVDRVGAATVTAVRRGERITVGDVDIEAVHAAHGTTRGPYSRASAEPVGYVVRAPGATIYFAGDTGLFDDMRGLGPIDVALVPIWGWGKTLGELHLDPTTAADATERIDPAVVVPIHWGTYSPLRFGHTAPTWLDRPIGEFRRHLDQLDLADRLVALDPGGAIDLVSAVGRPTTRRQST
jgi:L-ascorbate metabolism protein UlaG (beta-lactamase superfamily)